MKLYNPFKWHLVQIGDKYALRKYFLIHGWKYLDKVSFHSWFFSVGLRDCLYDKKEDAQKRLGSMKVIVL
jgi:hypothetical protein